MKTRILAMLLALAMIVTVFAACGGNEASTSTSEPTTSDSTSVDESTPEDAGDEGEEGTDDEFPWTKYDDVTITLIRCWNGQPDAEDDWYENALNTYIRDQIGITLKNDGCMMKETEKLNLMFASGDMPDIVNCPNWGGSSGETPVIKKGADEGQILDISAYITGDKSDMFQYIKLPFEIGRISVQYWENDVDYTGTGALYWIPQELTGEDDAQHWSYGVFCRGDVPETLGFVPEDIRTTDQLVEILYQAQEYGFKDANGNDCIVASTRHTGWSYHEFLRSYDDFKLSEYILNDDGTVTLGRLTENYVNKNMVMWDLVNHGIFDVECFTHSDDRSDQNMATGTVLFYGAMYSGDIQYNNGLLEDHPDWLYEAIGPLNYASGKQSVQIESVGRTGSPVCFFPVNCSNLEACLTYYDYMNSPEGQAIYSYGIPGVTFDYNEEGLPRCNPEYWPVAGDDEATRDAKTEKREELGIGRRMLDRTQLINQQKTWFKENFGESLGAEKLAWEEYRDYYQEVRRPIERIPGYGVDGLVNKYERYDEIAEILDDTVQNDYVTKAFFAATEDEARALLEEYQQKIMTDKDGLMAEYLDWIASDVVGSRDDIAW